MTEANSVYGLRNKIALITGGSQGIGYGIARQFIFLGAKVIITGRSLEQLHNARSKLGANCVIIQNDVTRKKEHPALIEKIESEVGPIDILVNNAGMHHKQDSMQVTDEDFQKVIDTNLNSVFSLSREVLKKMVVRRKGSIINISSMSAIYGLPRVAAYASSKTALLGLTRSLAAEYSHTGVRINSISPGFIETEMLLKVMESDLERKQKVLSRTPMNRLGTVDEIGYAAAFLGSDAAEFITGINLPVDGGNSIGF